MGGNNHHPHYCGPCNMEELVQRKEKSPLLRGQLRWDELRTRMDFEFGSCDLEQTRLAENFGCHHTQSPIDRRCNQIRHLYRPHDICMPNLSFSRPNDSSVFLDQSEQILAENHNISAFTAYSTLRLFITVLMPYSGSNCVMSISRESSIIIVHDAFIIVRTVIVRFAVTFLFKISLSSSLDIFPDNVNKFITISSHLLKHPYNSMYLRKMLKVIINAYVLM